MPNRNVNLATEFKSSGKTQLAFCTDRGISINTLRYYLYKKGKRSRSLQSTAKSGTNTDTPAFLSFNREPLPGRASRSCCAIIMGSFSIADVTELLSGMFQS